MRPIQLQLKNFMSYGEDVPPLRFDGMHVVCLSGRNGHGKSALLDAITWALWGKSRARSDDDLIHRGRQEMLVDLEFLQGNQRYRVRRERALRGKRGRSTLEFFVWDDRQSAWRPLTEPSMRATQARIIETLRLDYDTFINSAYLRQGKADEFTTKTPGERKQVLAEILNLERYSILEQRAREKMKDAERRVQYLTQQRGEIEEEIAQEEKYRRQLAEVEATLAELTARLEAAEEREKELQVLVDTLRQLQDDVRRQQRRVREVKDEIRRLEEERASLLTRLEESRAHLARREAIETRYQEFRRLREEEKRWNTLLNEHVRLQKEVDKARLALQEARMRVEQKRSQLQQRLNDLRERASLLEEAARRLEEAKTHLGRLEELDAEQNALREHISTLREEQGNLQGELRRLKEAMHELKERIERLEGARGEPDCPLCGQPLTEEHVAQMLAQLQAQGRELGDRYRQGQARLKEIQAEIERAQVTLKGLEAELRASARWQRAYAKAEQDLQEAQRATDALQEIEAQLTQLEQQLAENAFAPDLAQRVAALEADLTALGYDEAAHARVREVLEQIGMVEEEYRVLQLAAQQVEHLEERLRMVDANLQRQRDILERETSHLEDMEARLARLPDVEQALRHQMAEVNRLSESVRTTQSDLGAVRQQLAAIQAQKKRLSELEKELHQQKEAVAVYRDLVQAFGKNGLQAMIIEAVLPEIEQEANRLLARMTEGRMTVRLKAQRDLRTGGTAETLDIEIADELGARPYEMYSGGEAFRINFALRIALSKLLARRAGASLRTLFIDEGFGSQDDEGRLRLVDAINSIQDEFDLIVVITHIEELKEAFPVRIEVFKGPHGSTFTIA